MAIPYMETGPHDAAKCFVFIPPFAEEMNRTRRLISLLCQRLAAQGHLAVQFDLPGTGDSPLGFENARLKDWLDSVRHITSTYQRDGHVNVGVRFGAALVQACADDTLSSRRTLSIAAITSGGAALRPYTRAAGITNPAKGFEAAGYSFSDELVADLLPFAPKFDEATAIALPSGVLPWLQVEPDDTIDLAAFLVPAIIEKSANL